MPGPDNQYQTLALQAAQRIDEAKAAGQQLTFLPDEPSPEDSARTKRGKGKATSQLRDWLAARGMRMPEDVIIEMAGMASSEDTMLTAMAKAEQMLTWAQAGAASEMVWVNSEGERKTRPLRTEPTMAERIEAFKFMYTIQLRAAEALVGYGLAKVTPEDAPQAAVQVFVAPGGSAQVRQDGADRARDVTPQPGRLAPPPLPHEMQQNQQVAQPVRRASDASDRTE